MEALVPISASFEKLRHLFRKPFNEDCRWCQELYETGVRIPAQELIQGTLAGCPACQLLYQTVDPANLIDPRIELVSVWYFGDYVRTFGDSFVSHIFDPKSEEMSRRLCHEEGFNKGRWHAGDLIAATATYPPVERCVELFSVQGSTSHWPLIATAKHVAPTADTPESIELIKAWLFECEKKHHGCKKPHSILPDRAVFVGPRGDPCLVETHGSQGKYIALSHRWGGHVSLQLKKDSLDDLKRGIPFSRFPRTFQDAITICRALGVEHIWIDSICIIQDSKEDWDIQGSKMDQVYANCLLTIAADAAENGDSGFITNPAREALKNKTRKIVCTGPKGQVGEFFVRPLRQFGSRGGFGRHYDSWERGDLEASQRLTEQGSYLLKRGWVLQETFLPRRILHFLPDEFSWRCASASRCECKVRPHDKKRVVHEPLDLELPREINTENLKEYWKEVVEQYTRRKLTFPSDRLVALAGLASRAHSINPKVNYYAGLCSDVLPSTLLWIVDRPVGVESSECACKRIEPAIAPTWSWASVTGYARFLFWERNFGRGK
ncbi:het domain-containing [Fusarium albosuccineum]|uniref:Het domain-containing n=1 Tax=Fusarium albosuccineum TaxID=1237068 RepID=A0A8H4P6U6_9HYPO|nr:het domain-containing [Fusarium albosuccineum]